MPFYSFFYLIDAFHEFSDNYLQNYVGLDGELEYGINVYLFLRENVHLDLFTFLSIF